MDLRAGRWGNSFALRLLACLLRSFASSGWARGATAHAQVTPDGILAIQAAEWRRSAFAVELDATRAALPMGQSVADELRQASRY